MVQSDILPDDYEKSTPPAKAINGRVTEVTINMAINSIDSIDEKSMVSSRLYCMVLSGSNRVYSTTVLLLRHLLQPAVERQQAQAAL